MSSNDKVGIGRRKTAVSSVILRKGTGKRIINGKEMFKSQVENAAPVPMFEKYFPLALQREEILAPLVKFDDPTKYDLLINVKGGGLEAQAIATRLGISRALVGKDLTENSELRGQLKELGYLTRDSRKKERKKFGQKGARKRFQFSKR